MPRILVVRISSFGDVAMLVPVIASVAARYPQSRFSVLTRPAFTPLFNNLGFNINTIPLDTDKRHKGFRFLKILGKLHRKRFTEVVDVHDVLRSKVIRRSLWLTGVKTAYIDKGRLEKAEMVSTKQTQPPLKSTIERYFEVFERAGYKADMSFSNFFDFSNTDFYQLRSVVAEKKGRWIAIAPFAKHREKIYPLEKMEKVIATLSKNPENNIFLFVGGKGESEVANKWCAKYPNTINTAKKLNLSNELLLMYYMDVMISMDSANMHLASIVQVPVVSIWGATHPSLGFYGFKQDPDNAIQIDLDCRPCSVYGEVPCVRGDYACMNGINEQVIVDKVEDILAKKQK